MPLETVREPDPCPARPVRVGRAGSPSICFSSLRRLASAVVAGTFLTGMDPLRTRFAEIGGGLYPVPTRIRFEQLGAGLTFGVTFIGILLAHELGHYLAARRHRVPVSLPYFIPFPPYFSIVGTLGAFIRLRGPMANRSVLFDIGVAGPLVSFVLSVPALVIGLHLSEVIPTLEPVTYPFRVLFLGEPVWLGNSAVLQLATWATVPGLEPGRAILPPSTCVCRLAGDLRYSP